MEELSTGGTAPPTVVERERASSSVRSRLAALDPWDGAYLALAVLLVAFISGYVVNGRRSGDVYLHAAVIERLAADPWSPSNPMVATSDPDVGFSPYALALGMLSRVTGLSGFAVLDVMSVVLIVTFVALLPAAVRVLTGGRSAASFLALALTLAAWGSGPWQWSGYLSLNSIGFMSGYPAMAAWCALLVAVIVSDRLRQDPGWFWIGCLATVMSFIALTHPITLIGAVPLVVGVVVVVGRPKVTAPVLAAGGFALLAVVSWPYFSAHDLFRGGEAFDQINRPTYHRVVERSFLAFPGVVALAWRVRRPSADPLVMTGVVGVSVFFLGDAVDRWTLGRALPFVLFAAHLALAGWLSHEFLDPAVAQRRRLLVAVATGALLVAGIYGSRSGIAAGMPRALVPDILAEDSRLTSEVRRFDPFAVHLGDGDVVVSVDLVATRAVPALGASAVWPGFPTPFVDDVEQRRHDSARFFYGDAVVREAIVDRYSVTHAMVLADHSPVPPDLELVAETDRYRLFELREPSANERSSG